MGWADCGTDARGRRMGYAWPARCDQREPKRCHVRIDRGLAYVCGGMHEGGEHGCGDYFCPRHLTYSNDPEVKRQICRRCARKYDKRYERRMARRAPGGGSVSGRGGGMPRRDPPYFRTQDPRNRTSQVVDGARDRANCGQEGR